MVTAPLRADAAGATSMTPIPSLSSRSTSVDDHLERTLAERNEQLNKHMRTLQLEVDERKRALSLGSPSSSHLSLGPSPTVPGMPNSSRSSGSGHGSAVEVISRLPCSPGAVVPNSARSSFAGHGSAAESSSWAPCSPGRVERPHSSRSSLAAHGGNTEASFYRSSSTDEDTFYRASSPDADMPMSSRSRPKSSRSSQASHSGFMEEMFPDDAPSSCSVDTRFYTGHHRVSPRTSMSSARMSSPRSPFDDISDQEVEPLIEAFNKSLLEGCLGPPQRIPEEAETMDRSRSKSSHESFSEPAPSMAEQSLNRSEEQSEEQTRAAESDTAPEAPSRNIPDVQMVWEVSMSDMNSGPRRVRRPATIGSSQEGAGTDRHARPSLDRRASAPAGAAGTKESRSVPSAPRRERRTAGAAAGVESPPAHPFGGMQAGSTGSHSANDVPEFIDEETENWMKNLRTSEEDQNTFEDPLVFGSGFKPSRQSTGGGSPTSASTRPQPFGPRHSNRAPPEARGEAKPDSKFECRPEPRFSTKPSGQPHDRSQHVGSSSPPTSRAHGGSHAGQQPRPQEKARPQTDFGGEPSRPRTRPQPQPQPQSKPQSKFPPGQQSRASTGPEARAGPQPNSPRSPGTASPPPPPPRNPTGRAPRHERANRTRSARGPSAPAGDGRAQDPHTSNSMQVKLLDALKAELSRLRKVPSPSDRKKHFFKLCLQWHPDKNPSNVQFATKGFQMLQEKKGVLLAGT